MKPMSSTKKTKKYQKWNGCHAIFIELTVKALSFQYVWENYKLNELVRKLAVKIHELIDILNGGIIV